MCFDWKEEDGKYYIIAKAYTGEAKQIFTKSEG